MTKSLGNIQEIRKNVSKSVWKVAFVKRSNRKLSRRSLKSFPGQSRDVEGLARDMRQTMMSLVESWARIGFYDFRCEEMATLLLSVPRAFWISDLESGEMWIGCREVPRVFSGGFLHSSRMSPRLSRDALWKLRLKSVSKIVVDGTHSIIYRIICDVKSRY